MPGRPILSINVVPVGLVFMASGFLIKRFVPVERIGFFVAVPLFAFTLWSASTHPGNVAALGSYWYFPGAVVSVVLYLRVAQDLQSSAFLGFIGTNRLIVYGIHGLVAATYPYTRLDATFASRWDGLALYAVNAVYSILGSVTAVKVYRMVRAHLPLTQWVRRDPATA